LGPIVFPVLMRKVMANEEQLFRLGASAYMYSHECLRGIKEP